MYLRRWTAAVQPPMEPFVYVYRRGQTDPERRAPTNLAWERGLYAVDPRAADDGDPEVAEKALSAIEHHARRAFAYIDAHGALDSRPHILAMSNFLAVFVLRTRKGLLSLEQRMQRMAETFPEEYIESQGGIDAVIDQLRRRGVKSDELTAEKVTDAARRAARRIATNREFRIQRVFGTGGKVAGVLQQMNWCVVNTEFRAKFITCDAPVLVPEEGEGKTWWEAPGVGFATLGAEVWFTLDPDRAVVASFKPLPRHDTLPAHHVQQINEWLAHASLEFVVCHRGRPQIAKLMAGLRPIDVSLPPPQDRPNM